MTFLSIIFSIISLNPIFLIFAYPLKNVNKDLNFLLLITLFTIVEKNFIVLGIGYLIAVFYIFFVQNVINHRENEIF